MKEDGKDIIIETAEEAYEYFTNRQESLAHNLYEPLGSYCLELEMEMKMLIQN